MVRKAILATLGFSLALGIVAKAETPTFKEKYKTEIMRLNADEKNLAMELEKLLNVPPGKYKPKVRQLLDAKLDLTKSIRAYDKLVEHFTPNVKQLAGSCADITAKKKDLRGLWDEIAGNANDFGQFMQDISSERGSFESTLSKLDQTTAELCRNSDLAGSDTPSASNESDGARVGGGQSYTRDSEHLHAAVTKQHEGDGKIAFHVQGAVKGDDWRDKNSTKMIVYHNNGSTTEVPFSSPGGVRNVRDFSGEVTVSKANDKKLEIKTKRLSDNDKDDDVDNFPKEFLTLWTNES